jgi:hypothetical protein
MTEIEQCASSCTEIVPKLRRVFAVSSYSEYHSWKKVCLHDVEHVAVSFNLICDLECADLRGRLQPCAYLLCTQNQAPSSKSLAAYYRQIVICSPAKMKLLKQEEKHGKDQQTIIRFWGESSIFEKHLQKICILHADSEILFSRILILNHS